MKFSTSLDFNAHSDWKDNYINYDRYVQVAIIWSTTHDGLRPLC